MQDVLYPALARHFGKPTETPGKHEALLGADWLSEAVFVDQSPIGKTARSNPASYVGAFDEIRKLFATTPVALERNYGAGMFSFNAGDGRCPTCGGSGFEHVEMQFLSDVYLRCPDCDGKRFRAEMLDAHLVRRDRQLSIADVLELTVSEAVQLFADDREVIRRLQPIVDVGLDYVKLGQPVPTLSGGEAQRLKLAGFLAEAAQGPQQAGREEGHAVPVRRAHHGPALRRHRQADALAAPAAGGRPLADRHRAQPRRDPLGRLAGRPRPRRRRGRRRAGGRGHAGRPEGQHALAHGPRAARLRGDAGPGALRGRRRRQGEARALRRGRGRALQGRGRARRQQGRPEPAVAGQQAPPRARAAAPRTSRSASSTRASTTSRASTSTSRAASSRWSRACRAPARARWRSTSCSTKGQRRYLESLNAYARSIVQPAGRPEVDAVYGIPPTVAIEQRLSRGGRKSTVATTTEVWHFLRLLWVKLGIQHCINDGSPVKPQSVESIAAQLLRDYRGQHVGLLAPLVVARKGVYTDLAKWAKARGHTHLRVDGEFMKVDPWPRLDRFKEHTLELPVGDLVIAPEREAELRALLAKALDSGKGVMHLLTPLDGLTEAMELGHSTLGIGSGEGVLHQARVPDLRHQLRRARPAHVLVQQQARLVPGLRRHRPGADARAARGVRRFRAGRERARPRAGLHHEGARRRGAARRGLPRLPRRAPGARAARDQVRGPGDHRRRAMGRVRRAQVGRVAAAGRAATPTSRATSSARSAAASCSWRTSA